MSSQNLQVPSLSRVNPLNSVPLQKLEDDPYYQKLMNCSCAKTSDSKGLPKNPPKTSSSPASSSPASSSPGSSSPNYKEKIEGGSRNRKHRNSKKHRKTRKLKKTRKSKNQKNRKTRRR